MTAVPTTRLYYDDAYRLAFEATIAARREADGVLAVALDQSAFYPTSGGQAHDLGTLTLADIGDCAAVADVHADDAGLVWHVLAPGVPAAALKVGDRVRGEVDAARRADHRQQHSGQHVLSASCAVVCGAETRSVHLGSQACTLDLDRELSPDELAAVETSANRVVLDDRPVRVRFVDGAEAAALPLRRPTVRSGTVRLVEIDGHDLSACGGTHVARTGEIGAIVVCAAERFKGGARLTFVCGERAVASHRALARTLDLTARALSVAPDEVPAAVARLLEDGRELRRALEAAEARLSDAEAAALAARLERAGRAEMLVAMVSTDDPAQLRRTATAIVAGDRRAVVLLGGVAPHALVVARSADLPTFDAGAFARAIAAAHGGKAGGRPDLAQGGGLLAPDLEGIRGQLAAALESEKSET